MPVKQTPTKGPASGTSTPYKFENESLGLGLVESFFALHGTIDLVAPKTGQHFFFGFCSSKKGEGQTNNLYVSVSTVF
jgi:hypothetical protein